MAASDGVREAMKTADPELMRAINRFHVMDAVRRFGPISRVEISARTELSSTTVSAITAALLDDRLIVPRPMGAVRDVGRGRPRVLLQLNPKAAHVVGVRITPHRIIHVVTDFQGDVLGKLTQPVRVDRQPAVVIADLVEDGVRRCVGDVGLQLDAVASLCVALPGVVEHATGHVRQSPILRDGNVPFGEALHARLGRPILVESDANAMAMGEHWFRQCRDVNDFLVVTIEHAVGLAVMHDGQLFRGAKGLSFNLGDLVTGTNGKGDAAITRLADVVSEAAILEPWAGKPETEDARRLGHAMPLAKEQLDRGDSALAASTLRAGDMLGLAIVNLITLFAPPRVVLVGSSLVLGEHLMTSIHKTLARATPAWLADIATIITDEASDAAWARGAAAAALLELYGAPWGTTGPARPQRSNHKRTGEVL